MPHFDIVKENHPQNTFRVSKVEADFDVKPEHSTEHFVGNITIPEKWNVGVIVGGSGTGKSTIAKELFGDKMVGQLEYSAFRSQQWRENARRSGPCITGK